MTRKPSTIPWKRRAMISLGALCVSASLQLAWTPRVDAPLLFSVPEISIQTTEASMTERRVGVPRRVVIPSIELNAEIVEIGLIENAKVDVPQNDKQVGWYGLGPRPGERGSAVLDGHLDIGGGPGIFSRLKDVRKGEEIAVEDEHGTVRAFRVIDLRLYDVSTAPIAEIFGQREEHMLNLITCAGIWRKELNHYDKRLVIFAEEISDR